MAYIDIVAMANSQSLRSRIAACAAVEGIDNPDSWAAQRAWKFASSPNWSAQWEYARNTATVNHNPDLGLRNDVISDANILSAVQEIHNAENAG